MNKFENYILLSHKKLTCGQHDDIFIVVTTAYNIINKSMKWQLSIFNIYQSKKMVSIV